MNAQEKLKIAEKQLADATKEVALLRSKVKFEESFGDCIKIAAVVRRDVSYGRLQSVVAVFGTAREATRYLNGIANHREAGLGVEYFDFYPSEVLDKPTDI